MDRFSFSIEWELDSEGRILTQWAGRGVIRSAAKLAYPMVQVRQSALCPTLAWLSFPFLCHSIREG